MTCKYCSSDIVQVSGVCSSCAWDIVVQTNLIVFNPQVEEKVDE